MYSKISVDSPINISRGYSSFIFSLVLFVIVNVYYMLRGVLEISAFANFLRIQSQQCQLKSKFEVIKVLQMTFQENLECIKKVQLEFIPKAIDRS